MGSLGAPEIIIIAVVAILLFGAAKLPVFAKSLGESMRIFKKELKSSDEPKPAPALPPVVAEQGSVPPPVVTAESAHGSAPVADATDQR